MNYLLWDFGFLTRRNVSIPTKIIMSLNSKLISKGNKMSFLVKSTVISTDVF